MPTPAPKPQAPQPFPAFDAALRAIVAVPKSDVVPAKRKAAKRKPQHGKRKAK